MAIPNEIENKLAMTAEVNLTTITNIAEDITLPVEDYPFAQIIETLDKRVCPLCSFLHGKIIRRGTPEWQQFSRPSHINCRRRFFYFHKDTRFAGQPIRPTFTSPPKSLVEKHGHFHKDPQKYVELRVPAYADRRQFVFKRIKDPATGEIRSVLLWQVPIKKIEGLSPLTLQVAPVSEAVWAQLKPLLRKTGVKVSDVEKAIVTLSDDPAGVITNEELTRESVAEVAIYMNILSPPSHHWNAILQGHYLRRAIFFHERAEMEALKRMGVRRIFHFKRYGRHYKIAHAIACYREAEYLAEWARKLGYDLPESAIIMAHPVREKEEKEEVMEWLEELELVTKPLASEVFLAGRFFNEIRGRF
ncbi:MAG: hypothetical protein RMK94_14550 [Armatimonadota bacterium]|nr:hypothetical protein [Armatimonadota bacterium]